MVGKNVFLAALAAICLTFQGTAFAESRIRFLDVGEGEATLIRTDGGSRILIDAGNPVSAHKIVRVLESSPPDRLDALIVTHPHMDHMGGVFQISQRFPKALRFDNGQEIDLLKNIDLYRWYEEFFRAGNYRALKAGDELKFGGTLLKILHPAKRGGDWNANSVVIKAVFGETSVLLTGDATLKTETELLKNPEVLKADVLKVGHHGAKDASSLEFLKAVAPKYAVVSTNRGNIHGYPSIQVLQRLRNLGIEVFLAYRDGDIEFTTDGKRIRVLGRVSLRKSGPFFARKSG